jgi:hypothetical protein
MAEAQGQPTAAAPTTSQSIQSAPAGVTPASTESVNPGGWMAGFTDDHKNYVQNKGYKGPLDILDSYRSLEKLHGVPQERLLKLPEKFYGEDGKLTPEGRTIYERVGAPKEAKEYGLDKFVPKENGDPKLMEEMSKAFYENGISKTAAEKIAANFNEYQLKVNAALKEVQGAKFRDSEAALKKEWGAAYEQNVNVAKEGMLRLGMSAQEIDSLSQTLGHDKTMKLLKNLGSSVGEHAFVNGRQPTSAMEPGTAKARIKELSSDKAWYKRLEAGGIEERAEWDRLHKFAFQGNLTF